MKVCFIGHKTIKESEKIKNLLTKTALEFIKKGVTTFLFGSKSAFDNLAWEVISELKKEFPYIKRIYVRSAFQYIDKFYEEHLLKYYEETYFPKKIENAGKCSYVERNYAMIDDSDICVFYYNENYVTTLKRKSGTKLAYEYARRKKKQIINLNK